MEYQDHITDFKHLLKGIKLKDRDLAKQMQLSPTNQRACNFQMNTTKPGNYEKNF